MNIRTTILCFTCAASGVAFGATSDNTVELPPVIVAAPAVRTDIRAACPEIDAQLQQSFSSAWGRVHKAQSIPVQFRVEGHRVTQTLSSMAAIAYRPYLRTAMSKLDCAGASGEAQDFKFLLVLVDPDDRSSSNLSTVALQMD